MFLIAICRQSSDKWQSKTLILRIFYLRSSKVLTFSIAPYQVWRLFCVFNNKLERGKLDMKIYRTEFWWKFSNFILSISSKYGKKHEFMFFFYLTIQLTHSFISQYVCKFFNPCNAKYVYVLLFSPTFILLTCSIPVVSIDIFSIRVENRVDPDQMASSEASWSGSTVFSKKDKSAMSMTRVNLLLKFISIRMPCYFH